MSRFSSSAPPNCFPTKMEEDNTVLKWEAVHEMFAKDFTLMDVRKRKSVRSASSALEVELIHTRTIISKEDQNERSCTVKTTDTDGQSSKVKETNMSNEELPEFEKLWNSLWKPELFNDEN